jgi:adenosine deaminase CECR1
LRTHPAAGYLNAGIQCVLASDDPLYFGNDGLTFDFWEATIAWNLDLKSLKRFARNSIIYSGLDAQSKEHLMNHWNQEWDRFINKHANQKQ